MHKRRPTLSVLLALACAVALMLSCAGFALADAGDFVGTYDYGGGSVSGGEDASTLGDLFYVFLYIFLYVPYGWVIVLAIVIIIAVVWLISKLRGDKPPKGAGDHERVVVEDTFDTGKLRDMSSFQAKDPSFKQEDMREQVSNLYVQLQNAWTDKDLSPMRPFFSDGLYSQFDRQLDRYRDGHITNKVEGIAVLGVVFEGWYQDDDQDCIALKLSCRITDYTVDDATGEVVKGSPYAEKFMSYRWILSRSSDLSTEKKGSLQTVKCPNCFGVVQINKTAKCPYCDSIITLEEHDWVVTAIQGLSQTTVG